MRTKRALFCASMLGGLVAAATAAAGPVLPTGGVVKAGSATIGAPAGGSLTVSQTSSKAIIDWQGFSIGQGGSVQFDNGAGATLNRVTGANISSIDGLLSATGSVYLINPNGVIVGKTGVVNTGGTFVASTLDVANSSFLAGGPLTFSGPSTASVVNLGKVSSLGGNVAMIAATAENDGSIAAPKGDVGLIAGTTVTMDDTDNDAGGLFSVQVGDGSTSATNTGAITAAAVELRAQQGNVYALAGNTGGVINATGIDASGGTIKLISTEGTTTVTGTLSAQGPNGTGGQIETSGETLDLGAASVDTHGGSWLLDPTNLIINSTAASAIDSALASGNVTLATSASGAPTETGVTGATGDTASGAGDITVASPLSWSSARTLTLDAYAALIVDAPITVTGAGKVVLDFNTAAADAPGGLSFDLGASGFAGSLSYAVGSGEGIAGQALTINGASYTLLYSMSDLASVGGTGHDALAAPVTATAIGGSAVLDYLSGTLEGLGNSITGLTIDDGAGSRVGLIGKLNSGGVVRDLGLLGGSVTGLDYVGGLAAVNAGAIVDVITTGAVSAPGGSFVGALVGDNVTGGTIIGAIASGATVSADGGVAVGGLVGYNSGTVTGSSASDAVDNDGSGDDTGGLVGYNAAGATIASSSASGTVAGGARDTGGLVGDNIGAVNGTSAASGNVSAPTGAYYVGGLAGFNAAGGTITAATASGATVSVSGGVGIGGLVGDNAGTISNASTHSGTVTGDTYVGGLVGYSSSSVTGASASDTVDNVSGRYTGGLVGYNVAGATISSSTGSGLVTGGAKYTGGLAGYNAGTIDDASSATGNVSASGEAYVGGLVGANAAGATITDATASGAMVSAGYGFAVGGLAGYNAGTVTGSSASDTVYNALVFGNFGEDGGYDDTGGLVGYNATGATISSSTASGAVTGSDKYTGGLVGYNAGSISGTSSASGNVLSYGYYIGGLAGENAAGATIAGATASGASIGSPYSSYVGGLVGRNDGTISNASTGGGTVAGSTAGGLVGINNGHITDSSASDTLNNNNNPSEYFIGGLIGDNEGAISNVSATGNVETPDEEYVGGLVGYNGAGATITNAFATGQVNGGDVAGGLVGFNGGTISNAYANNAGGYGGVIGGIDEGGLIGQNDGEVSTSWSAGFVRLTQGGSNFGGSIGLQSAGTVSDVYWDEGTSGQTLGVGGGSSTGVTGIGGTTGLSPYAQATYAGFNFSTLWTIKPGTSRPYLQNPAPATPPN